MKSEKIEQIVDLAATLAARADEYDQVMILYRTKADGDGETSVHGSMDNGLELRDCLWLVESFKLWLTAGAAGLLKRKDGE
jgi:hypothetical protein